MLFEKRSKTYAYLSETRNSIAIKIYRFKDITEIVQIKQMYVNVYNRKRL